MAIRNHIKGMAQSALPHITVDESITLYSAKAKNTGAGKYVRARLA